MRGNQNVVMRLFDNVILCDYINSQKFLLNAFIASFVVLIKKTRLSGFKRKYFRRSMP